MRKSKTLARVREGKIIRGCSLGYFIPGFICHAAHAGYDCIWLDLEHRAMPEREVQALLAHAHLYDIDMMVRPPTIEQTGLYRYLEEGAAGLMIPFVSTAEKARMLVEAVKFPPLGNRGIDNAGLDADFTLHSLEDYLAWAARETFLCVQIETPEAVRNVDSIAAVEGVDILMIGPGDLGLRLKQSGEMTIDEAWQKVTDACRKHDKPFGAPFQTADQMAERRAQGASLIINGSDFRGWATDLQVHSQLFDELE